ncbi:hypothetical protein V6N13_029192 [Hibiscus sabdariffa]
MITLARSIFFSACFVQASNIARKWEIVCEIPQSLLMLIGTSGALQVQQLNGYSLKKAEVKRGKGKGK